MIGELKTLNVQLCLKESVTDSPRFIFEGSVYLRSMWSEDDLILKFRVITCAEV